jgi:hypothetical protein
VIDELSRVGLPDLGHKFSVMVLNAVGYIPPKEAKVTDATLTE